MFDCASSESTSVVFPWSTCAMIAMLRTSLRVTASPAAGVSTAARGGRGRSACVCGGGQKQGQGGGRWAS
eukprot:364615-Chlamydomonas_euryale.AAC.54